MSKTMTFNRPKGVRIVDMCIWVDQNMHKIKEPGKFPKIEDQMIQYLYFIVDSLAKKQNLLPRFEDYDEFALYSAGVLFLNFRGKIQQAGEIVRGKEVIPVKSCLNFIKTILYPYKVAFQQANYDSVINPYKLENPDKLQENMREEVRQQYHLNLQQELEEILEELPQKTYKMLVTSTPYRNDPLMIRRIYMSLLLSFINNITLPNKLRNKVDTKIDRISNEKLISFYQQNSWDVILWHLPDHMEDYIRILLVKMKRIITEELNDRRYSTNLTDEVVDSIMKTAFSTYDQDQEEW